MPLIPYSKLSQAVRFRMTGREGDLVSVRDVGLFLSDLGLLYELHRLANDPTYSSYRFNRYSLYRNRRSLPEDQQLLVERLRLESPLELVAAAVGLSAAAAGAVWAFLQSLEKVYNLPLTRRKLELEISKLELEVEKATRERADRDRLTPKDEGRQRLLRADHRENAEGLGGATPAQLVHTVENRLRRSPIVLEDVDFEVVEETDAGDNERK